MLGYASGMDDRRGARRSASGLHRRRWGLLAYAVVFAALGACAPGSMESGPTPGANTSNGLSPTAESRPEPVARQWPNEATTGVPEGTTLTPWTGDCAITEPGTVIDARIVDCDLRIQTTDVRITSSEIRGSVFVRNPEDGHSFTISDSLVLAGDRMVTGIGNGNYTAQRVEVVGGRRSMNCETNCTIEDSWVHGQSGDPDGQAHLSGIRMGQNTTLRNNTITCEAERIPPASGCSSALTGYGDFAAVQNNLIEGNLFVAGTSSFCAFGGATKDKPFSDESSDIRFIDNVFERGETGNCGIHGAIVAFDSEAPGNVWEGNTWDDGEQLPPRN